MLKDKRQQIIEYVKAHREFLEHNHKTLDIYEGNLLKYVTESMQASLSPQYFNAIKDRILPINILQRYADKVSCSYAKPPVRKSQDAASQAFVDYYSNALSINVSGGIADVYSTLFKGYAWEPFVDKNRRPALRELAFDSFLVMSDSAQNPEEETIFIKFMGKQSESEESLLLHVYTDEEFDAFYLNGATDTKSLAENEGKNVIERIPFIYGKRQKNKLIPTTDSDILAISKAIPVMLSDAAGAQMFQCFSILWALDVDIKDLKMSPNAIWDLKSDRSSDKTPQVGTVKPEADTDKVVSFVVNMFVLWLETKGVRVGSVGTIDAGNAASGIAKIIDEMDVWEIKKKSQAWLKKDEEELWNELMPKMHKYWIESGMIDPAGLPAMVENPQVVVEFEQPSPMLSRKEELDNLKVELDMGTITLEQAIKKLYPNYDEAMIAEVVARRIPV
jgi:hypothetical protein